MGPVTLKCFLIQGLMYQLLVSTSYHSLMSTRAENACCWQDASMLSASWCCVQGRLVHLYTLKWGHNLMEGSQSLVNSTTTLPPTTAHLAEPQQSQTPSQRWMTCNKNSPLSLMARLGQWKEKTFTYR